MFCNGTCPGFENDGVCNVPNPCRPHTDCADCRTLFPTYELASFLLSLASTVLLGVAIACRDRRERYVLER